MKEDATLDEHIAARMKSYGIEAQDACRELALIPVNLANSPLMDIKLRAAVALLPDKPDAGPGAGPPPEDPILKALNDAYHATAKRISSIRERTVTFSDASQTTTIEGTIAPLPDASATPNSEE